MKNRLANTFLAQTLLISHLVCSNVYAQIPVPVSKAPKSQIKAAAQTQTNVIEVKTEKKEEKTYSLDLAMEYSEKIAVEQRGARESNIDFVIAPVIKLNSILKLGTKVVVTKENSGARQTTISNTPVSLVIKGIKLSEQFKTLHSVTATAATNEETQKRDRLKGAIGITNGIGYESTFAKIEYRLGISKNFHEFTVNSENSPNVEYRLANTLTLLVPVTEKLSITAAGLYRLGRTYGGFQRSNFTFDADIVYDVTGKFSLNLGTSNDGNALKANGVDSNIEAYNENTSVVRAGISLTL